MMSGPSQAKNVPKMCRFILSCSKYHPGLLSPFLHSVVSHDSAAQADLGLCCLHIPEDIFLQVMANLDYD